MGEYLESPEIWRLNATNAFSQWLAGDRKPHMSVGRVKWSGMKWYGLCRLDSDVCGVPANLSQTSTGLSAPPLPNNDPA